MEVMNNTSPKFREWLRAPVPGKAYGQFQSGGNGGVMITGRQGEEVPSSSKSRVSALKQAIESPAVVNGKMGGEIGLLPIQGRHLSTQVGEAQKTNIEEDTGTQVGSVAGECVDRELVCHALCDPRKGQVVTEVVTETDKGAMGVGEPGKGLKCTDAGKRGTIERGNFGPDLTLKTGPNTSMTNGLDTIKNLDLIFGSDLIDKAEERLSVSPMEGVNHDPGPISYTAKKWKKLARLSQRQVLGHSSSTHKLLSVVSDSCCKRCGKAPETLSHALFWCTKPMAVWSSSGFGKRFEGFRSLSGFDILCWFHQAVSRREFEFVCILLWFL
ncbi:hypothetical protein ACOSQ3_009589 [Xanthoceras sorbifolium]